MELKQSILLIIIGLISLVYPKHIIVWKNFQELLDGGWYAPFPERGNWGAGFHFDKPSDIDPALALLDAGVTGDGVITGTKQGIGFQFRHHLNTTGLEGIKVANLTLKYYYEFVEEYADYSMGIRGCDRRKGALCKFTGQKSLGWHFVETQINLTYVSNNYLGIFTSQFADVKNAIVDEVRLTYELENHIG